MATQITNQATLSFTSGLDSLEVSSNIASVTMQGPLEIYKRALESGYRIKDDLTYTLIVKNTSATTLTNVVIEDDLGTFALGTVTNVTPLTYVGPANQYLNDVFVGVITPTVSASGDLITFTIPSLAANTSLLLQYRVETNDYAQTVVGTSVIDNIASVTAAGVTTPVTASFLLPVASYADLSIKKTMEPNPVVDGSTLTYTFRIENYGTIPATDVQLRDAFTTLPDITTVLVDNVATTDYDYTNGLFVYPAATSATSYTIPAATFTQDAITGIVTVTPGVSEVVIQGTI